MYSPKGNQPRDSNSNANIDEDDEGSDTISGIQLDRLPEPQVDPADNQKGPEMSADTLSEDQELEDLKAFERRLMELAAATRPRPFRWPLVLGTIFACTAISACHWLDDMRHSESILLRSLSSRGALAISLATIVVMIYYGVKQVTKRPPSVSVEQTREALALFQMECDNDGHLVRVPALPRDRQARTPSRSSRTSRTSR